MPPAIFPTPPNPLHAGETTGPQYLKLLRMPDEYAGLVVKTMTDGGATYGGDTTNTIKRWKFSYDGLTAAELATLTDHRATAFDTLLGFTFRDPRSDTLFTDVHYESLTLDHKVTWSNSCEIVLIKRPA